MPGTEIFSVRTIIIFLVVSVGVNIFLGYRLFNTALSLDYARTEQIHLKQRTNQALSIIDDMTSVLSKSQILTIATELSKQGVVVKKQPYGVQIGDIVFKFAEDKVNSVNYIK